MLLNYHTAPITQKAVAEQQQAVLQRIELAVASHDEAAFTQAVNDLLSLPSVERSIRDFCWRRLKKRHWQGVVADIDDLQQEVKIKFWLNLWFLRKYSPAAATAYLRIIVSNVSTDGFRRYRSEANWTLPLEEDKFDPISYLPPPQIVEPKLKRAMESLKQVDKEILEKKFIEGHSLDEIADQVGMSRSNVHVRLTRALDRLRDYLSAKIDA